MALGGEEAGVWVRSEAVLAHPSLGRHFLALPLYKAESFPHPLLSFLPSFLLLTSHQLFIHWLSRSFPYSFHCPFVS